jgi:hypothetical protein
MAGLSIRCCLSNRLGLRVPRNVLAQGCLLSINADTFNRRNSTLCSGCRHCTDVAGSPRRTSLTQLAHLPLAASGQYSVTRNLLQVGGRDLCEDSRLLTDLEQKFRHEPCCQAEGPRGNRECAQQVRHVMREGVRHATWRKVQIHREAGTQSRPYRSYEKRGMGKKEAEPARGRPSTRMTAVARSRRAGPWKTHRPTSRSQGRPPLSG